MRGTDVLKRELYEIGQSYVRIAKNPLTLVTGSAKVAKDIFYEAPKRLFVKTSEKELLDPEIRRKSMNSKASASLAISELVGYFGSFAGSYVLSRLGVSPYIAANVGGIVGNYIAAVPAFVVSYSLSTRREHRIEGDSSFKTSLSCVAKAVPAAAVSYLADPPIVSGLVALGASPEASATAGTIVTSVIFTSAAKTAIDK